MAICRQFSDVSEYLRLILPDLMMNEAANCLYIGIANSMKTSLFPDKLEEPYMLAIFEDGVYCRCAFMTLHSCLILPAMSEQRDHHHEPSLLILADFLLSNRIQLERIIAKQSDAANLLSIMHGLDDRFNKRPSPLSMAQVVYKLSSSTMNLATRRIPDATCRLAELSDVPILAQFARNYYIDCKLPFHVKDDEQHRREVTAIIDAGSLWVCVVNDEIMSMCGLTGRTKNSIRLGRVFTPLQHRGLGYGSLIVGFVCRLHLDAHPDQFVTLLADESNNISNRVYVNIGFEACGHLTMTVLEDCN